MATINVNVDEKIKEQAKETLEHLGPNFTNAIKTNNFNRKYTF